MATSIPHKPVVLIAEDEHDLRGLLQTILVRNGFEVVLASDGQEALQKFRDQLGAIDIVLMDVGMPCLDGLSTLNAMLTLDPMVVCCLTTGAGDNDDNRLYGNGAAFILQKPFRLSEVPKVLRRILERQPSNFEKRSMAISSR